MYDQCEIVIETKSHIFLRKKWNQCRNQTYGYIFIKWSKRKRNYELYTWIYREPSGEEVRPHQNEGFEDYSPPFLLFVLNSFLPLSPYGPFCLPLWVFISNKGWEKHEIVTNNNHERSWYLCSSISSNNRKERRNHDRGTIGEASLGFSRKPLFLFIFFSPLFFCFICKLPCYFAKKPNRY